MIWTSRYARHAALVHRMAETLGVDLVEEAQRGNMPPQDMRNTVMSCLGCTDPTGCADWLDDHVAGAARAPGYCRNRERLEAMAEGG